jgi:hypothetical protein
LGVVAGEGENDVANDYENHQVGFDSGPADCLGIFALRRKL